MALIQCPKCGTNVSDKADACPNCGNPISTNQEKSVSNESNNEVSKIDPQEREFYKSIRNAIERKDYEEAYEKAEILLSQTDHPDRYCNLKDEITEKWTSLLNQNANLHLENGQKDIARDYIKKALVLRPNDPIFTRKLEELNNEIREIAEGEEAKKKASQNRIIIACAIAIILVIGGLGGYSLYKKSLVVDVPSNVTSSDMIALFSSSNPDAHTIAAYSEKYAEHVEKIIEIAQKANSKEEESDIANETKYAEDVLAKLNKIVKAAGEDDRFVLTKNIDIIKKNITKIKKIAEIKKAEAKEATQKMSNPNSNTSVKSEQNLRNPTKYVFSEDPDGWVNVRFQPNAQSEIVQRMYNNGDGAIYLGKSGNWYKINYKGTIGYVHKDHARLKY